MWDFMLDVSLQLSEVELVGIVKEVKLRITWAVEFNPSVTRDPTISVGVIVVVQLSASQERLVASRIWVVLEEGRSLTPW